MLHDELAETGLPLLLSKSGEAIEMLGAQSLVIDLDTGAITLSGELTHFSEVWDNLPRGAGIRVRFSGIPTRWPVGPIFTVDVHITRAIGNDLVVDSGEYVLLPVLPIDLATASAGQYDFDLPGGVTTVLSDDHDCAFVGIGEYSGSLHFFQSDISDFLGVFGGPTVAEEIRTTYESTATRTIECIGPSSGADTPASTDTPVLRFLVVVEISAGFEENLYAGPGYQYEVVGFLAADSPITVVGQSGNGFWLQTVHGSWLPSDSVDITGAGVSFLPVIEEDAPLVEVPEPPSTGGDVTAPPPTETSLPEPKAATADFSFENTVNAYEGCPDDYAAEQPVGSTVGGIEALTATMQDDGTINVSS